MCIFLSLDFVIIFKLIEVLQSIWKKVKKNVRMNSHWRPASNNLKYYRSTTEVPKAPRKYCGSTAKVPQKYQKFQGRTGNNEEVTRKNSKLEKKMRKKDVKKEMQRKERREKKKMAWNDFFFHSFIIMAYWINIGSRGRAVITGGLKMIILWWNFL